MFISIFVSSSCCAHDVLVHALRTRLHVTVVRPYGYLCVGIFSFLSKDATPSPSFALRSISTAVVVKGVHKLRTIQILEVAFG